MDVTLAMQLVRELYRAINRVRFGTARELQLFCYESHLIDMRDPENPDIIRLLSDRALHWWVGKVVDPTSRSMLEREVRRREAKPAYWVSISAVMISAVALIGTIVPLVSRDSANNRRCVAIQRDMLSAQPRRADGPDLFQALGCRPQGEGSVYAVPERPIKKLKNAAHAPNI